MKKRFSIITYHIDSNTIKPFINECLCFDENNFKEIRKQLPKELKIAGFTSVRKVPFQSCSRLTTEILKIKFHIEPTVAKLLLKSWYSKHIAAIEIIKAVLISLGYKISEPDFNSNRIEIQQLKVEDIYSTEGLAYFRPNGHQIAGLNDEESTIAASLLGWVVIDSPK
ncbi:MAG: hypothetical protein IPH20_14380 [Bacteroidales bacterium]|nr:hypothetical protein [Bacteroidales bacterium]